MGIFEDLRTQASDLPEMTLDEINEEISAARAERKKRQQYDTLCGNRHKCIYICSSVKKIVMLQR